MSMTHPARLYAAVVGAVLVAAGLIGFLYEPAFSTDETVRSAVFGLLDVNGFHNVIHIATGAAALLAARTAAAARTYCLVFGALYSVVAVWGFMIGEGSILSIVPVNTPDNILHVLLAVGGLGAWAASAPRARTARTAAA